MVKNSFKKLFSFYRVIFILCFMFQTFHLSADPIVIRGVDGTWLPVLVTSWTERNNGVILKPHKDIDPQTLRTKLLSKFPNLNIEIINRDLFFPSINTESLFSSIGGIDIGITLRTDSKSIFKDPHINIYREGGDKKTLTGDNIITAEVQEVSFNEDDGIVFIDIMIMERAPRGKFRRYFGRQRIKVVYTLKENGTIDKDNVRNKKFGKLLLLKEGSVFSFIPEDIDQSKAFIISDYSVKKF